MSFDLNRLNDRQYFAENRLPAHSDHRWFASSDEVEAATSSFEQSLNGLWKFHHAKNPTQTLPGFESPEVDCSNWADIPVPGHIQLHGHDRAQYTNTQYPWDGHDQIEPGRTPMSHNPVSSYVKTFVLDHVLAEGERLSAVFNGAESAIAVWLNGQWIGYSADTFTPSEFDLTDALVEGENKLACQVFRWTSQSWLEDQDFYRFSGLFRDVVLKRRPAVHVEDLRVTTELNDTFDEAVVRVVVERAGAGRVTGHLAGVGDLIDTGDGALEITVAGPVLWSAEQPHLYDLTLTVVDQDETISEVIPVAVGIRRVGIEDGLFKVNGQRVVFKGVNRHEFGLQGRVVDRAQTEADLRLLKSINVNAIRTSHYPNNSYFYELADQYGFYVIDEMNLETHGLWDQIVHGGRAIEDAVPGDDPTWLPSLLDRANSMLQRDKNHACIVMWSCGNESFGGSDLLEVSNWFRTADDRPVHYEGVHWDPRHPETSDVVSEMYTPAATVEAYLAEHRDKPFILCEYAHNMGNSFGAVHKYTELTRTEPLFQGSFIWDFADQAILLTDAHGVQYFGYGGDCGERPHDADFSGNGIVFADRTPKPAVAEVKKLYQDFVIEVSRDQVSVTSERLFTDSGDVFATVVLAREGQVLRSVPLDLAVGPGQTVVVSLPVELPQVAGEYTIDVTLRLRRDTTWAPIGHEVAFGQGVFTVEESDAVESSGRAPSGSHVVRPTVVQGIHNVGVRGEHFEALFSRISGGLVSYRHGFSTDGGRELLRSVPRPNFWHAPTSNERGWGMPQRDGQWLLASRYATVAPGAEALQVREHDDHVEVACRYLLPSNPGGECLLTHRVFGDGAIEMTLTMDEVAGLPDLPEFGLLLTTPASLKHLRWYGDGPDESYVDRRHGSRVGLHRAAVAKELTPYLRPQEAGSHTGVRWAEVTDDRGFGLRFEADQMEFSALPWTPYEIESALHPNELPPITQTVIRPALQRRGVAGDQSWGAMTHPEYLVRNEGLEFTVRFRGIG